MSIFDSLTDLLRDPPPEFAFEISAAGIAMSRTRHPAAVQFAGLPAGALHPSPVRENVVDPAAFRDAVRKLASTGGGRGRRAAALILPDNAVRLAVMEFDNLPEKEEDRRGLIRFRLRKSIPFDIDAAALSYHVLGKKRILAAITPAETIAHYEAPFRAVGLNPGLITVSSLAMLEILPATGTLLVAHRSAAALTVLALHNGELTLARSLELSEDAADPLEEVSSDLYPTLAFVEDSSGIRPEKILLAGFGDDTPVALTRLSVELEVPVESIPAQYPGLAGYLKSLSPELTPRLAQRVAA